MLCCACMMGRLCFFFFFQAEDGIRDVAVTGVQTCALPICPTGLAGRLEGRRRHELAPVSASRWALPRGGNHCPACIDPEPSPPRQRSGRRRSEEHTSELQSRLHLVCRLLLEKKKKQNDKLT